MVPEAKSEELSPVEGPMHMEVSAGCGTWGKKGRLGFDCEVTLS